jgi:hypothetical protein
MTPLARGRCRCAVQREIGRAPRFVYNHLIRNPEFASVSGVAPGQDVFPAYRSHRPDAGKAERYIRWTRENGVCVAGSVPDSEQSHQPSVSGL